MCAVPVLMYHALEDAAHPSGAQGGGEQRYVLPASEFREQMAYLRREGYRPFILEDLRWLAPWPEKAVVLTFDDGHQSNVTLALPILQEFGFKAHFFITTGWTGKKELMMDEEEIRALHQAGMAVGSHGVTHSFLSDLPEAEVACELSESKEALEGCLGAPVTTLSYPGGRMSRETQDLAHRIGYRQVFTSEPGYLEEDGDQLSISRFAITAGMTLEKFASLLDGRDLNAMVLRHNALAATKSILGNDLYVRVRGALIGSGQ